MFDIRTKRRVAALPAARGSKCIHYIFMINGNINPGKVPAEILPIPSKPLAAVKMLTVSLRGTCHSRPVNM